MLILSLVWSVLPFACGAAPGSATFTHPRLYFNAGELEDLRKQRDHGTHAQIWKNMADSADWCLERPKLPRWIGPIYPDPNFQNTYDRFYGIIGDIAITEHLSFAYAIGNKESYGATARLWLLALCHEWQHEAETKPDSSRALTVSRLLKGIAIGYDLTYDRLSREERQEIRELVARIVRVYFPDYFQTTAVSGPAFHNHTALVEWSSLGVVSLTFLGEIPEARDWLTATITKFEDHLLPNGLEPDGASSEGGSIWASTMLNRIFFMAALRHVTDVNLFQKYAKQMNADLALAAVACEKNPGYDQNHASVVLQPSFAQLDYYAPVLFFMAREYGRPTLQHLALWDHSAGQIQKTRFATANGYQLLVEEGGYAYIWDESTVRDKANEERLSFQFPSVDEAYLRQSWQPGDIVAGVSKGELVVNAGGQPVLVEPGIHPQPPKDFHVQKLEDDGSVAKLEGGGAETNHLLLELNRPERTLRITRRTDAAWQWSCQGKPVQNKNEISWEQEKRRVQLSVVEGEITAFNPEGFAPIQTVAGGKLMLADPAPVKNPKVTVKPGTNGVVVIEIKMFGRR